MARTPHPRKRAVTNEHIRQWILADEGLYLEAREFGGGNDEDMYRELPNFINKNRPRLVAHIRRALQPSRD